MKIMIVDDHSGMRGMLRSFVAGPGFEVCECSDGSGALAEYASFRPNVVLMDILMAPLDGLAATRQLMAAHPEARVVIVSEQQSTRSRKAAQEAGACAFVSKDRLLELPGVIETLRQAGTPAPTLWFKASEMRKADLGFNEL